MTTLPEKCPVILAEVRKVPDVRAKARGHLQSGKESLVAWVWVKQKISLQKYCESSWAGAICAHKLETNELCLSNLGSLARLFRLQ